LKIFVSSTTRDFADARKKVCERLLQLDIQPVSMDSYASDPKSPQQLDDAKVKSCDAFVIIVGHLYGSCPPDKEKSFTELEYEVALNSHKPVYTFLASEQFTYNPNFREEDAANTKIKAFRDRLAKKHSPRPFDNADNLCVEVIVALASIAKSVSKLLVPLPPISYLAHPYPLQENFTGRLKERAMLTDWIRGQIGQPILSLVGMGGLGKSALTWFWLNEDLPHENLKFEGIIWWSFYEQEASFESFISHALFYASGRTIDPAQFQSDYDRMLALLCILQNAPFLIILDGLERLLRAYHALDAAYKGDDFSSEAGDKHLFCANPLAGAFLQWLATSGTKTKTLITTRFHPKEFHNLAGCRKEELQHLEPDDAYQFMRSQGIKGPRTAIIHACEPYDFLPLCLRLLSGAIREDPQKPCDIAAADNWHPPANLTNREHHILQISYDTMAKDRRDLLSRIAAMRGPVNYVTAKVLSKYKNEEELKAALRELVARGLLFRQKDTARYDLHPIVRQYAYEHLGNKTTATHTILKDYFAAIPQPDKIRTLDDLLPAIELFHHTIRSGDYEDAFRIYCDRLSTPLFFQLGAYDTRISLIQTFFIEGETNLPHFKDESKQGWILNELAGSYYMTGQTRKTLGLVQQAIDLAEKQNRKDNLASGLINLVKLHLALGNFKQAKSNLQQQGDIAREIKNHELEASGYQELGLLLVYTGRYELADKEFQKALGIYAGQEDEEGQCVVWSYLTLSAILLDRPNTSLYSIRKSSNFAKKWSVKNGRPEPNQRDLIQILRFSGVANRLLGNLIDSETNLNDALSRCRKIRLVEFEADILLELAKLHYQKAAGKNKHLITQAKDLTSEALDIADRCEYRLQQADIHNFLAEMAIAEGDKTTARKHAEIAKERAFCDGPPHAYQKALDTATQLLAQLPNT
jgi:tetratricopeptide (TPR) repeat protein